MNENTFHSELRKLFGNGDISYSLQDWISLSITLKFVPDKNCAEELFVKFDSDSDGLINIFDIENHYELDRNTFNSKEEIFSDILTDKFASVHCKNEDRILSFFKTIQSQYPNLQRYFEDLLIDIINEISEVKKEFEKLENTYNKERNISQGRVREIETELESWASQFENEMKKKLSQYECKIKSLNLEKYQLEDEIDHFKKSTKEHKVFENSSTYTNCTDDTIPDYKISLSEFESNKACNESKLKFLESELQKKEEELEEIKNKFRTANDNCQILDASLQNLVCANRKLNDDNDHLRSTLISLSHSNSLKSINNSHSAEPIDVTDDSGLSTQVEYTETDNEFVSLNKLRRIHNYLSHQNGNAHVENLSYYCDNENIESPVHGPLRNQFVSRLQNSNKVSKKKNSHKSISETSTEVTCILDENSSTNSKISISETIRIEPERMFKIMLVGDTAVGKTSFMLQFCKNSFDHNLQSTVGIDYNTKTIFVDGRLIALQLWDTAGQEKFRSIVSSYFRRADGVVLMYDVTNSFSFLNVRNWIDLITKSNIHEKIPIMLVGNKIDTRDSNISNKRLFVKKKEGELIAKSYGLMFKEVSVKDNVNLDRTIIELARKLKAKEDIELSRIHLSDINFRSDKKCCSKL